VPTLAQRPHHSQLLRPCQKGRVRAPPPLLHLVRIQDLRLLVLEWPPEGPREVEHLGTRPAGALQQAPDGLQIEAVGLQLLDELDPGEMLLAVVAGAAADRR